MAQTHKHLAYEDSHQDLEKHFTVFTGFNIFINVKTVI